MPSSSSAKRSPRRAAASKSGTRGRSSSGRRPPKPVVAQQMNQELQTFVLDFESRVKRRQTMAVLYFAEDVMHRRGIGPSDLRDLFLTARLSPPANPSIQLSDLAKQGLVLKLPGRGPSRYVLASPGRALVRPEREEKASQGSHGPLIERIRALPNASERSYLEEAADCLEVGARRGAVVMGWAAAMANLRTKVETGLISAFNTEFARINPNSRK